MWTESGPLIEIQTLNYETLEAPQAPNREISPKRGQVSKHQLNYVVAEGCGLIVAYGELY